MQGHTFSILQIHFLSSNGHWTRNSPPTYTNRNVKYIRRNTGMEIQYPTFPWAEPPSWAGKYSWRHVQPTLIVIVHVQYRNVIHGLVLSNYEQPFTEYTLQNSPHSPRRDCRPLKLCFENCPTHCSSAFLHVRGVTNTTFTRMLFNEAECFSWFPGRSRYDLSKLIRAKDAKNVFSFECSADSSPS